MFGQWFYKENITVIMVFDQQNVLKGHILATGNYTNRVILSLLGTLLQLVSKDVSMDMDEQTNQSINQSIRVFIPPFNESIEAAFCNTQWFTTSFIH
jgi:hypothetical protein